MKLLTNEDLEAAEQRRVEAGTAQGESVNLRLLDAATQALLWVQSEEISHGRQFGTGNALRAAIKAANQVVKPSYELMEPLSDEWLSKIFYAQPGRGFVIGRVLSIFNTKNGYYIFAGKDGANDSDDTFKISDVLTSKRQLLAFLDGIGLRLDKTRDALSLKGSDEAF